jgi:CheY-like chemotaxis protein
MNNLLIVDSDPITLHAVVGLLKSQGGFFNVLSANSGSTALEILPAQPIHMVITGFHLPEIETYELMAKLEREHPHIRMIVMTNSASPMLRSKIKQMTAAVHFDQALDLSLLIQRILSELEIEYGGRIRGVSLPSFLQMMELEDRHCTLKITTKGKSGYLFLQKGKLIAAEFRKFTGRLAALQILTWKNVTIDIDYALPSVQREITKPLMSLIMESGRLIDEDQRRRSNLRKHERFECLMAVDYDLSDWTYQCCLLDISEGGAYILTEQQIQIGQRIIIALASTDIFRSATINAKVIRRDQNGIGVAFTNQSLQQKKLIENMRARQFIRPTEIDGT